MSQQRKLPSKRYSSYLPPTEDTTLEEKVSSLPVDQDPAISLRTASVTSAEKSSRRKSLNTLHFDALQNAVSRLSRIDDFDLEELGYGFFSDVFKVTHKQSGKVMVLKRNKSTNTKLNILREVQLMNRLSHPNILKFMGVCVHEGQLHGLTEYINGGDLDQLVLQKNTVLSWTVRIRLALDISKGLSYLHSIGIFHRDLTAKNCLIRMTTSNKQKTKYTAIVADLGLAEKIPTKPEDEAKLRIVGTPYSMAPEVLREKPYNERSDFFSFGIIICQLIIRTSSDPEKLPRANDFGLQKDLFAILVKQGVGSPEVATKTFPLSMPPDAFLQLAYECCEVDPSRRPELRDITCRLEQTLNEEKMKRIEKKKSVLKTAQEAAERQSLVSIEIPPKTSYSESSTPRKTSGNKLSVHSKDLNNKENNPNNMDTFDQLKSRSRSSSGYNLSRLSRSSSDVSKELISHAASIIASSQTLFPNVDDETDDMSSVVNSLQDAFINPFRRLENFELREKKLYDTPSSELIEMTFDLPTPGLPSRSPTHSRRRLGNSRQSVRPKSLLLDVCHKDLPQYFKDPLLPRPLTPEPYHEMRRCSNTCGSSVSSTDASPSCPTSPLPTHALPFINPETIQSNMTSRTQLKQALIRSMAFSPRGHSLVSWWNNNGRAVDWRSLTSLLSVMTEKLGTLRRSISVPDLSQDAESLLNVAHNVPTSGNSSRSSVASEIDSPRTSTSRKPPSGAKLLQPTYPAYVTLPRKKKVARCQSANADFIRKRRSRTSDDVFHDQTLLEILPEEGPDVRLKHRCSDTALFQHDYRHVAGCLPSTAHDLPEINNNNDPKFVCEDDNELDTPRCYQTLDSSDGSLNSDCLGMQMSACRLDTRRSTRSSLGDASVSSSSSSSGMSSTGIRMTLYSGMVSTNRRRRIGIVSSPPPESGAPLSWSLYDSSSHHNHNKCTHRKSSNEYVHNPHFEDHCISERNYHTARSNRDSGYNEDILLSADHSCNSQSSHDTADSGVRSRSASSIKSVSFTNPLCATLDPGPTSTPSSSAQTHSEYIPEVTPSL